MKNSEKNLTQAIIGMKKSKTKLIENKSSDDFTKMLGWHYTIPDSLITDERKEWLPCAISQVYIGRGVSSEARGKDASFFLNVAYLNSDGMYHENARIFFNKYEEYLQLAKKFPNILPNGDSKATFAAFIEDCKENASWAEVACVFICKVNTIEESHFVFFFCFLQLFFRMLGLDQLLSLLMECMLSMRLLVIINVCLGNVMVLQHSNVHLLTQKNYLKMDLLVIVLLLKMVLHLYV